MPKYKVTAWICPPHTASVEIEAESAAEAVEKAIANNCAAFDRECFEDCGDWPGVDYLMAESIGADGFVDETDGCAVDLDDERLAAEKCRKQRDTLLAELKQAADALAEHATILEKSGGGFFARQAEQRARNVLSQLEAR